MVEMLRTPLKFVF